MFLVVLDDTILNVALPTLQRDLEATASQLQWFLDSYLIVFGGLLLAAGSLGDRFGRRGALLTGWAVFGAGSLGAAVSTTPEQLIAARCVMGLGAACIMPTTLSILTNVFPPHERPLAIGLWAGVIGVGVGVGPVVSGALLEHFWWGSVFLINVPVVAVGVLATLAVVPDSRDPSAPRVDWPGVVLSTAGVATLNLCYHRSARARLDLDTHAWRRRRRPRDPRRARLAGAPHRRADDRPALLPQRALHRRLARDRAHVLRALWLPLRHHPAAPVRPRLQRLRDGAARRTGRRGAHGRRGRERSHRRPARREDGGRERPRTRRRGLAASALGDGDYGSMLPGIVAIGFGMGVAMSPATDAVMGSLPLAKAGVGSAVNDTTRQLGAAFGVAIVGSVLASRYGDALGPAVTALPSGLAEAARDSVGATLALASEAGGDAGAALAESARAAYQEAMRAALLVAAGVAASGAVLALAFLPAHERRTREQIEAAFAPASPVESLYDWLLRRPRDVGAREE